MEYNTQVIRDRNSIKITWTNENGDLWTVRKAFGLGTRKLMNATINCSAELWDEAERKQAHNVAWDLDAALQRPEDFDRVKISDNPATGGRPAHLDGIIIGGPIYIAIAKEEKKMPDMLEALNLAQYALEAAWLAGITGKSDLCTTLDGIDRDKFLEARTRLRDLIAKVRGELSPHT